LFDDLERRDFTLNALARNEDGTIIDYFDGLQHLREKILVTPLPCKITFDDDPLRILRAIRFSVTKGFKIPYEMDNVIKQYDYEGKMDVVSMERIREELFKCFKHDTLLTMGIMLQYGSLFHYVFNGKELWLKPTMEL
jgi:tRNA nucleotidyltransferase/poly(A) polymerase